MSRVSAYQSSLNLPEALPTLFVTAALKRVVSHILHTGMCISLSWIVEAGFTLQEANSIMDSRPHQKGHSSNLCFKHR